MVTPVRARAKIIIQWRRSTGRSALRPRQAKGVTRARATNQRQKDRLNGGIDVASARPTMELPAQNSTLSVSSRGAARQTENGCGVGMRPVKQTGRGGAMRRRRQAPVDFNSIIS